MILNANTKRARGFIEAYNNATARYLSQAYKTFSDAKRRAQEAIYEHDYYHEKRLEFEGKMCFHHDYRIMAASCHHFTIGRICDYQITRNAPLQRFLVVDTAYNKYIIPLN